VGVAERPADGGPFATDFAVFGHGFLGVGVDWASRRQGRLELKPRNIQV
jgi:hypothetical protein